MRVKQRLRLLIREYLRERAFILILITILFVMGLIFGCLAAGVLGQNERSALMGYISQGLNGDSFLPRSIYTRQTVIAQVKTVFFLFLMGISVIGVPLALLLIFAWGFILGFSSGFMVQSMGFKGVLLTLTGIVPHNLLAIPGLFLMLLTIMDCAAALTKIRFTKKPIFIGEELVKCSLLTAIVLAVMVCAGLIKGYVTPELMSWMLKIL